MKTFKGTKGEWKMDDDYLTTNELLENNVCPIATIHSMLDGKNNEQKLIESKANIKLIASAPELLEALINIVNQIENEHVSEFMDEFSEQAKKAINEAL